MNVMNEESVSFYTLNDNLDIVNNKYVIASTMVGVVITIKSRLEKSYNNMFYRFVIE